MHVLLVFAPVCSEYSPAAHAIQNDPFPTPVISEKVPAGQAMQNLLAFRPTASE